MADAFFSITNHACKSSCILCLAYYCFFYLHAHLTITITTIGNQNFLVCRAIIFINFYYYHKLKAHKKMLIPYVVFVNSWQNWISVVN
jgi:hypothetical protein